MNKSIKTIQIFKNLIKTINNSLKSEKKNHKIIKEIKKLMVLIENIKSNKYIQHSKYYKKSIIEFISKFLVIKYQD